MGNDDHGSQPGGAELLTGAARRSAAQFVSPGQEIVQRIAASSAQGPAPQVEIVVPVRNEERALAPSIRRLVAFLRAGFPFRIRITIADNGSSDGTWTLAEQLAARLPEVRAVRLESPGRGRALRSCWLESDAEILAYMDVDLSSGLEALLPLVAPLMSGHSDLAIGSRLARGARVRRGSRREVISRCYNLLLHAVLDVGSSDAQCGFKAIRADKARQLLPLTEDNAWFFDTELLVLAERAGLRIHEVPVDWVDDPDSSVDLVAAALADLRGITRLCWRMARGELSAPLGGQRQSRHPRAVQALARQLLRFAGIGLASTVAYIVLYLLLRPALSAQADNAATLLVVTAANTAANRRITFGIRGRAGAARHQVQGLITFGAGLAVTSAALTLLHTAIHRAPRGLEIVVLVGASLLATVLRFMLYRNWVFRPRQAPPELHYPIGAKSGALCRHKVHSPVQRHSKWNAPVPGKARPGFPAGPHN